MASLQGFDASQVPEQQEFSAIPAGQYVAIATASEMKPTTAGTGQYLQFTFEVLDGPCKGRKVWARLNLVNPNATAVDIAQRELGAICRAVGVIKPSDSSELHNKPLLLTVDTEFDDKKKRENNVIKKYEPVGGAPNTGTAFGSTPSAATPAAGAAAAPAASGAAPWQAGGAAAPWAKK